MSLTARDDRTLYRLLRHGKAVRENWSSVVAIKIGLESDDYLMVAESWAELDWHTKEDLWVAPLYGGIWTTAERKRIIEMHSELNKDRLAVWEETNQEIKQ